MNQLDANPFLPPHAFDVKLDELIAERNAAYTERNRLVAFLARIFPSVRCKTAIPGWDEEWYNCVYIDTPAGQMSWHFHDADADLFAHVSEGAAEWDGHSTPEKYERLQQLINEAWHPQREPNFFVRSHWAHQRALWQLWEVATFGEEIAANTQERGLRLLEEALELAQSLGVPEHKAVALAATVYSKPVGVPAEEVQDVLSTFHILCATLGEKPELEIDALLERCHQRRDHIRKKWNTKIVARELERLQNRST